MTQANTTQPEVWTIGRLLNWTRDYFTKHEIDEPRLAAEILLAKALSCKRIELYTRFDQVPGPDELTTFREFVKKAAAHTPISYLVGNKEFFSLTFEVDPSVLIPRVDTEVLVQQVIDYVRANNPDEFTFLDMGTGSGCVAIALLKYLSNAMAVATDISDDALEIAKRNAETHDVADRLKLVKADRLDLPADTSSPDGFDVIVSNPPYISEAEMDTLHPTVKDHEPKQALSDGADGLTFYRALADQAAPLLKRGGSVFVEIAEDQADAVRSIFEDSGNFEYVNTWRDQTGPHNRVIQVRLRS